MINAVSHFVYNVYSPLQKYWNGKGNSFVFNVYWSHLDLISKDEYELEFRISTLFLGIYMAGHITSGIRSPHF